MSKATTIGFNGASLHSSVLRVSLTALIVAAVAANVLMFEASAQKPQTRRRPVRRLSICGDPRVPCKTVATFQPNDLSFRLPENAVIYDTDLFYAVILKSVSAADDNCDIFVPEGERLAAQALFPGNKVFFFAVCRAGWPVLHRRQPEGPVHGGLWRHDTRRCE